LSAIATGGGLLPGDQQTWKNIFSTSTRRGQARSEQLDPAGASLCCASGPPGSLAIGPGGLYRPPDGAGRPSGRIIDQK
jgi:hypothetical protein